MYSLKFNQSTGLIQNFAQKQVFNILTKITTGKITIEENGMSYNFGKEHKDLHAVIRVSDPGIYLDIMKDSMIGAGESFMAKKWGVDDLTTAVRILVANRDVLQQFDQKRNLGKRIVNKIFHWLHQNSQRTAKTNIHAHYDLGNDFFKLFLDSTMMYSSGIYPKPNSTLEEASVNKLDVVCQKLELKSEDHLVEIGTGWGGMAIHAAKEYGCQVTTTTISEEQYRYAKQRVKEQGLEHQITVLLKDYRELAGTYDKLVSIEMIEAVGYRFHQQYFQTCQKLLKPTGLMLIQAITIADQRFENYCQNIDFIQRYIFPGGCLPSNEVIAREVAQSTQMQIIGVQDITIHYAQTLRDWQKQFQIQRHNVRAMGYSETFCRMWEFYLSYCEGGFRERAIGTAQFLIAGSNYRFEESV